MLRDLASEWKSISAGLLFWLVVAVFVFLAARWAFGFG